MAMPRLLLAGRVGSSSPSSMLRARRLFASEAAAVSEGSAGRSTSTGTRGTSGASASATPAPATATPTPTTMTTPLATTTVTTRSRISILGPVREDRPVLLVSKFLPARDAPRSDISRLPHNSSTDAVPSLPEFATTAEKTDFLQRITDRIRAVNHEAVQGPVHDPVKTPLLRAELKRRFMRGHCRGRLRAVFEGRRVSSARVVDRGDDFHALPALRPLSVAKLPSASSLLSKVKRRQDEDGEATGTAMGTVAPSSPLASDPVYHALTRQSMLEVERMKELDEEQQMRIIDGVLKRVCAVYLRGISDGESGDEKSCASSEEIGDERARDRAQDIGGKPTLIVARLRRTLHWLMETCFAVQRVDLARMAVSAYDEVAREIAYKENANDGSIKLTRSLRANKRQLVEALVKMQVEQGALKGAIGDLQAFTTLGKKSGLSDNTTANIVALSIPPSFAMVDSLLLHLQQLKPLAAQQAPLMLSLLTRCAAAGYHPPPAHYHQLIDWCHTASTHLNNDTAARSTLQAVSFRAVAQLTSRVPESERHAMQAATIERLLRLCTSQRDMRRLWRQTVGWRCWRSVFTNDRLQLAYVQRAMEVSADVVPDQDPVQQQRQPDNSDPSMNSLARAWFWVHLWESNGVELVPGVLSKLAVHLARTSVTVDTQRSIVGRSRENIIALLERDNGIDGSSGASNTLVSPPTILALIRALTHTRELRLSMAAHTFIHALLDRYTPIERDPRWTERQLAQLTFELGRRGDVAACWRIWRRVEAIAATRDDGVAAAEIRASTLRQFTHAFAAHSDIRTLTSFIRHIPTASPARGEALISIVDRVRHRDAHRQLHDAFTDLTPLTPYAEMADLSSPSRIYGRSTPTSLLYNVLHAGAEHYRALKGMQADEAARDFSMRLSEAVLRLRRRVTGSRGVEHGTELRRILEAVE